MKRVHVLVEGQTEETFVRTILTPHLHRRGVHLTPILVETKRRKSGGKFKGGVTRYERVRRDLQRLLGDSGAARVTTMLDYYGLPEDFPGRSEREPGDCYERVETVERALAEDLGDPRLLPYLSLHEFEALLFSQAQAFAEAFPASDAWSALASMAKAVESPEEINDGADTHPSARIKAVLPPYQKTLHGPQIAGRIGLELIRRRCPHFDGWVRKLESV